VSLLELHAAAAGDVYAANSAIRVDRANIDSSGDGEAIGSANLAPGSITHLAGMPQAGQSPSYTKQAKNDESNSGRDEELFHGVSGINGLR
jgi:hypothetical protein